MKLGEAGAWLHRRAENVAAGLLAVMFLAFVVQIVFRYLFNFPIGWASELTVVCWLWLVLWGSAFVLKEKEEIRFDLLYGSAGRRARIAMGILFSAAAVILYSASFKASYAYVTFMKVEKSSYLKIRMDWLYSIYLIFLVAIIARYLWKLWNLARGRDPEGDGPAQAGSGL
jgi:TRAP-type C4-dicarboxylate transport system permease small subunit